MGLKLSTAFPLLWSLKHRIVLPKVSHSGSSSLFQMLFKCSAILPGSPLSFFTKSLAHRLCQELSNLATLQRLVTISDVISGSRCWLSPMSFLMLFNHSALLLCTLPTLKMSVQDFLLLRVRVNILILSHAI